MVREKETLDDFFNRAGDSAVLVSACLLGLRARWDGSCRPIEALLSKVSHRRLIPVCPEQMGGLATPRVKASLSGGDGEMVLGASAKVVNEVGRDVTENFLRGARQVLDVARIFGARFAILKERSPSCGVHKTYIDFELTDGCGVTTAALKIPGIEILAIE